MVKAMLEITLRRGQLVSAKLRNLIEIIKDENYKARRNDNRWSISLFEGCPMYNKVNWKRLDRRRRD